MPRKFCCIIIPIFRTFRAFVIKNQLLTASDHQNQLRLRLEFCILVTVIYLGFGIWDLGFGIFIGYLSTVNRLKVLSSWRKKETNEWQD